MKLGSFVSATHRIITIDPPSSMDLDDALSVRHLPHGKVEIGVHIADPSFFVPSGSPLDLEAKRRASTL